MERDKGLLQYFLIQTGTEVRIIPPDRLLRIKDPDIKSMVINMKEHPEVPMRVAILRQRGRPTRLIPIDVSYAFHSRLEGLKGV